MASYMPSFMSKHISTGAEAAYGQPFAFTTGDKTAAGTTPKSGKEKKKKKKSNKSNKPKAAAEKPPHENAAAEKPPHQHKHILLLKVEDRAAMKKIKMDHAEARYEAFSSSATIGSLNIALRAANAKSLQARIDILTQYYSPDAQGVENAKMKRLRKDLQYFQAEPKNTDSRNFTGNQFTEFTQIYTAFYSDQMSAMNMSAMNPTNEHTGADFQALMKKIVDTKKSELVAFYDKYPHLKSKPRAKTTDS